MQNILLWNSEQSGTFCSAILKSGTVTKKKGLPTLTSSGYIVFYSDFKKKIEQADIARVQKLKYRTAKNLIEISN